jgi:hypothetical protein
MATHAHELHCPVHEAVADILAAFPTLPRQLQLAWAVLLIDVVDALDGRDAIVRERARNAVLDILDLFDGLVEEVPS